MSKIRSVFLTVCRCAILCGGLFLYVYGYICYQKTLIELWLLVALVAALVLLTTPVFYKCWRWVTATDERWMNVICHAYVAGALWCFALLGGNYLLSDPSTSYEETVVVEKKISREHKKYQRVTRHRYRVTGVYYTYHLKVVFGDGTGKTILVSRAEYNRTSSNGRRILDMQSGFLGFPVVMPHTKSVKRTEG